MTSSIAEKQTVNIEQDAIDEVKAFPIKYRNSDILLKNINFIYSVDSIMDFNMLQHFFSLRQFRLRNTVVFFSYKVSTPYIHPRLESRIEPTFSDCFLSCLG